VHLINHAELPVQRRLTKSGRAALISVRRADRDHAEERHAATSINA